MSRKLSNQALVTNNSFKSTGNYTLSHEIGSGSFATVFLAKRTHDSLKVAIKIVPKKKLNSKLAENLETEIAILKSINHPHIVGLYEILKFDSEIHLAMEFCSMGDLSVYIKKKGLLNTSLPENRMNPFANSYGGLQETIVLHFLRQIGILELIKVSAMSYLHSRSLVHRDLKPQNILLTEPTGYISQIPLNFNELSLLHLPLIKIADFGFAKSLPSQSLASTLCGSPLYMAPEVLRGDKYSAKADLWSVGTMVYEMLFGKPPFKAHNHIDLLRKIDQGDGTIKFIDDRQEQFHKFGIMDSLRTKSLSRSNGIVYNHSLFPRCENSPISEQTFGSYNSDNSFQKRTTSFSLKSDLKDLIQKLLKRNPEERISFEEFFLHPLLAVCKPNETCFSLPISSYSSYNSFASTNTTKNIPSSLPRLSNSQESTIFENAMLKRSSSNVSSNNTVSLKSHYAREISTVFPIDLKESFSENSMEKSFASRQSQIISEAPFPQYEVDQATLDYLNDAAAKEKICKVKSIPSDKKMDSVVEFAQNLDINLPNTNLISLPPRCNDDYIVIEKRTVQVNYIADEVNNCPNLNSPDNPVVHSRFLPNKLFFPVGPPFSGILFPNLESKASSPLMESILSSVGNCLVRAHFIHNFALKSINSSSFNTKEVLDLLLLSLTMYQFTMNLAKKAWDEHSNNSKGNKNLAAVVNGIQWIRERFNECMKFAESLNASDNEGRPIFLILYDRALGLAKEASTAELFQTDSQNFSLLENLYIEAIMLLDVILSADDYESENLIVLDEFSRSNLEKLMSKLYSRLGAIRAI